MRAFSPRTNNRAIGLTRNGCALLGGARRPPPGVARDLGDDYERVAAYYVSQVASCAGACAEMKEGDGTVLDHSCGCRCCPTCGEGSSTTKHRLPVLTVRGLGGSLATGRVLDYRGRDDEEGKLQRVRGA
jgi:hypothetical protein